MSECVRARGAGGWVGGWARGAGGWVGGWVGTRGGWVRCGELLPLLLLTLLLLLSVAADATADAAGAAGAATAGAAAAELSGLELETALHGLLLSNLSVRYGGQLPEGAEPVPSHPARSKAKGGAGTEVSTWLPEWLDGVCGGGAQR